MNYFFFQIRFNYFFTINLIINALIDRLTGISYLYILHFFDTNYFTNLKSTYFYQIFFNLIIKYLITF